MAQLTLETTPEVIELAEKIARARGTSVSVMFEGFVRSMEHASGAPPVAPKTRELSGILKLPDGQNLRDVVTDALLWRHGS